MKISRLLIIAGAAVFAAACSEKEQQPKEEVNPGPIDVGPASLTILSADIPVFSEEGGEVTVDFSSNYAWKVTSDATWVTMDSKSGDAGENCSVTFTVLPNSTYDKHIGTVTITSIGVSDRASESFTFIQTQKGALILAPSIIEVGSDGEIVSLSVKANSEISYVIRGTAGDWIVPYVAPQNPVAPKAVTETILQFEIKPNELEQAREGVITFSNETGEEEDITISQEAPTVLKIPDDKLLFSLTSEGGEISIPVHTNADVSYVISPDTATWLVEGESTLTLPDQTYNFTVEENPLATGRTADIIFSAGDVSVTVTVSQEGIPLPPVENPVLVTDAAKLISFAESFNIGTYFNTDDLVVTLEDDIEFDATTSEAFNALGGIGNADFPFKGVFDGASHSINALEATVPLFAYIGEGAEIKDLTLTNECTFDPVAASPVVFGALAGVNSGSISGVTVAATVTLDAADAALDATVGGVIGENRGGSLSNVTHTGTVQITHKKTVAGTVELRLGGVIGCNYVPIDGGELKSIVNSGLVFMDVDNNAAPVAYSIGGIAGRSEASISGTKNTGYVHFKWTNTATAASRTHIGGIVGDMTFTATGEVPAQAAPYLLSGCENVGGEDNAGEVFLDVSGNASAKHTDNSVGGILGYSDADVQISLSTNSGYVHGGNSKKVNGTSCYVGGIVGRLTGVSSIADCVNSAKAYNDHFSNSTGDANTAFTGGIAGWVAGTDANRISISGCKHTTVELGPRRGYCGGIVGYVKYAELTGCEVSTDFLGSCYYIGGIAGWAIDTQITGCEMKGESISASQMQLGAGLVAKLDTGSVLDGCTSHVNLIAMTDAANTNFKQSGAIVGQSLAGCTIKNCHYPATGDINNASGNNYDWKICGDNNFTDGGGNVADL